MWSVCFFFFSPPTPFPRCNWNSQCPDNPHIMFYAILIVIILNPVLGLLQWKLYSPIILQKSVCFFFCRLTSFCTPQITERSMAFQPCEYLWGVVGWALHLAGHWSLCGVDLGQDVGLSATGVRAPLVLKSRTRKQEDPGQEVMALSQFEMVYYWRLYAFKNRFIYIFSSVLQHRKMHWYFHSLLKKIEENYELSSSLLSSCRF